jgi:hypothetical protein
LSTEGVEVAEDPDVSNATVYDGEEASARVDELTATRGNAEKRPEVSARVAKPDRSPGPVGDEVEEFVMKIRRTRANLIAIDTKRAAAGCDGSEGASFV